MKRFSQLGILLILAGLCGCTSSQHPAPDDLKALRPASGDAAAWEPTGEVEEYTGDDLYIYINGGAEIYQEYGFEQVLLQDYAGPADRTISLEIYRMTDAHSAFGMYTFKSGDTGTPLDFGREGRLEGYYLNFWKGPYIVTLTGFDESPETIEGLLSLGRAAEEKILVSGKEPDIIGRLPAEGLRDAGRKYVRGQLGLFNLYPFSPRNIFGVDEAVRGSYEGGYDLFIFPYSDSSEAARNFENGGSQLENQSRFVRVEKESGMIRAQDDRGTFLTFRLGGSYIVTALSARGFPVTDKAAEEASAFLEQ